MSGEAIVRSLRERGFTHIQHTDLYVSPNPPETVEVVYACGTLDKWASLFATTTPPDTVAVPRELAEAALPYVRTEAVSAKVKADELRASGDVLAACEAGGDANVWEDLADALSRNPHAVARPTSFIALPVHYRPNTTGDGLVAEVLVGRTVYTATAETAEAAHSALAAALQKSHGVFNSTVPPGPQNASEQ